jgi:hypothetical protein
LEGFWQALYWDYDVSAINRCKYLAYITNLPTVGTTPAVLGFGALTAVVLGAYDYTGGALTGYKKDPEMDEFERKEALRKNRRRPIQETISELGEGRGKLHNVDYIYTLLIFPRYLCSRI